MNQVQTAKGDKRGTAAVEVVQRPAAPASWFVDSIIARGNHQFPFRGRKCHAARFFLFAQHRSRKKPLHIDLELLKSSL